MTLFCAVQRPVGQLSFILLELNKRQFSSIRFLALSMRVFLIAHEYYDYTSGDYYYIAHTKVEWAYKLLS
jgi:hypothetical protein